MATHLKIALVTCLLMLIVTEEFKPVLAKKDTLKKRTSTLEHEMSDVQGRVKQLESCKGKYTNPASLKSVVTYVRLVIFK